MTGSAVVQNLGRDKIEVWCCPVLARSMGQDRSIPLKDLIILASHSKKRGTSFLFSTTLLIFGGTNRMGVNSIKRSQQPKSFPSTASIEHCRPGRKKKSWESPNIYDELCCGATPLCVKNWCSYIYSVKIVLIICEYAYYLRSMLLLLSAVFSPLAY